MKYTVIATCTIVLKLNSICFIFSSFQCQCNNRLWGLLFIWLKKLKSLTELLESGYVSCKYHRSNYTIFNFSSEPTVFGYLLPLRNIILRFIALEGFAVAIWLSYFCLLGFLPFLFLLSSLVPGMTQELLVLFFIQLWRLLQFSFFNFQHFSLLVLSLFESRFFD